MALLSDRVHRELKHRLTLWEYLPAERLGEEAIAREFKVSRTPVREALRRLEREGFLEHKSWAGYSVPRPDLPRIDEHYELRLVLEIAVVRKLADDPPKKQIDPLLETWSSQPDQPAADPELVYQDEAFHENLARIAGNATLASMLHGINEHIRIIRSSDFVTPKRILDTYRQHRGILLAIRRRDADQAAGRMTDHIKESQAQVEAAATRALARILTADRSEFSRFDRAPAFSGSPTVQHPPTVEAAP